MVNLYMRLIRNVVSYWARRSANPMLLFGILFTITGNNHSASRMYSVTFSWTSQSRGYVLVICPLWTPWSSWQLGCMGCLNVFWRLSIINCVTSSHAEYVFALFCRKQDKRPGTLSNSITKFLFLQQSLSYCTWVQMLARQFQTTFLSLKRKTGVKVRLKSFLFCFTSDALVWSNVVPVGMVEGAWRFLLVLQTTDSQFIFCLSESVVIPPTKKPLCQGHCKCPQHGVLLVKWSHAFFLSWKLSNL